MGEVGWGGGALQFLNSLNSFLFTKFGPGNNLDM